MCFILFIWLILYISLPHWNGTGAFNFNVHYIIQKFKVLYILNYNWIFVLIIVMALIKGVLKNDRIIEPIIILGCSDMAFVLFSFFYDTVNHARYIDGHVTYLYIIAFLCAENSFHRKYKNIMLHILILLLVLSNYFTIDPLSLKVFDNYNMGKCTMISTCEYEYFSDSMVYNQQYKNIEKVMNLAINDIVNEEKIIYIPFLYSNMSYFVEGNFNRLDKVGVIDEYWNSNKHMRVVNIENSDITYNMCSVNSIENLDFDDNYAYYLTFPGIDDTIYEDLELNYNVVEKRVYDVHGVEAVRLKIEHKGKI